MQELKEKIEGCFDDISLLSKKEYAGAIEKTIALLDSGKLRAAEYKNNKWQVNEWVKKAILLYFKIRKIEKMHYGYDYYDKIPLKKLDGSSRIVPIGATVRYGSFIEKGAVVGNFVTIKHNVSVFDGVTLEDNVFCGSCVGFINDKYPRSEKNRKWKLEKTMVKKGAT